MAKKHLFSDLAGMLPQYTAGTIFDVGANKGQTVQQILESYPQAQIFAFEPVESTFNLLAKTYSGTANVRCIHAALGSETAKAMMSASAEHSVNNHILAKDETNRLLQEEVQVLRGEEFCAENGIDAISILKIDTEGHDLKALTGFNRMLGEQRIDFIQVEAAMTSLNRKHVDLRLFLGYLEPLQYSLFWIYDQAMEGRGVPRLRRANLAFISRRCMEANSPPSGDRLRRVRPKPLPHQKSTLQKALGKVFG